MSKKIARLLQGRELLLGNEIVEGQPSVNFKDSGTLLVPEIMEYPEELTGGNLISEREPKEITANSNDWKYIKIYYGLKKNTTYTFSSDVEVLKGDVKEIHIYPYLVSGKNMALIKVPIIDGKIIATFTTDDRYNYDLLVYAGLAGSTNGNSIRLSNYRLREGSTEDEWGRNLLQNGDFKDGLKHWERSSSKAIVVEDGFFSNNGIKLYSVVGNADIVQSDTIIPKGTYTVQIWYKHIEGDTPYLFRSGLTDGRVSNDHPFKKGDGWQRAVVKFEAFSDTRFHTIRYAAGSPEGHLEGSTIIGGVKLELGERATPWTPAPEDLGIEYPDNVQKFGASIAKSNIVVPELIEDYSFKEQ